MSDIVELFATTSGERLTTQDKDGSVTVDSGTTVQGKKFAILSTNRDDAVHLGARHVQCLESMLRRAVNGVPVEELPVCRQCYTLVRSPVVCYTCIRCASPLCEKCVGDDAKTEDDPVAFPDCRVCVAKDDAFLVKRAMEALGETREAFRNKVLLHKALAQLGMTLHDLADAPPVRKKRRV